MAPLSKSDINKDGFWGEATSTIDWCEENYVVSAFLAEFWNTMSNWLFFIPPLFGAFLSWKNKLERRYTLSFISLCVVGIGSFCFHATLLYEMQLLDELPMIYCTCVMIFCICQCSYRPRQHNMPLALVLIFCCSMITLVYLTIVNPLIFQWAYGIVAAALFIGTLMAYRRHRGSGKLFAISLVSFLVGFLFWNIDNNFCSFIREIRNELPPPIRPFLQLHAIWHILAGIGSYYHILFSIDLRLKYLGRDPNLKLYREWLPFVYPAKRASSDGIFPTLPHNAAVFLLLFGFMTKLLK